MNIQICFPVLFLFFTFSTLLAQDSNQEALVKKRTEAYVEAYNKHDPHAIAAFWTEDGKYINPESGKVIMGKASLEEAFKSHFQKDKDSQLEVKIRSITFPSKNEALEIGLFHVKYPEKKPRESAFKAFFENQKGEWLISEIRNVDIATVPDQYQHLKGLEWLIGEWIDQDEDVEIDSSYKWNRSKNFILGNFSVITEGNLELEGTHIIGWDPIKKKIRSWVFDTDGTFGESTWTVAPKL